ncbi:MAG TPA: TetR/AcrR family transcriptional regulator [Candidatus Limnocylindrales bacterium]|nr:TetR/AcrR family transcriptional regulator [Candidatus Limnocylindrales bacterium]
MVETRRQQIEDAASALFRERGYPATTVRDIAQRLDIQGASLYSHVASKEDLLWSIVQRAAGRFEVAADRAAVTAQGLGCLERMQALVRAHVAVCTDDPRLATVFVHEWRFLSPARRAEVLERRDRYEARFRVLIVEGITCRAFTATDPALAATFILTALNGIATWYRPLGRLSAGGIADLYSDLATRMLEGSPAS